jgi:HAD domain in Swiss Army Knife RNA repair proteins
MNKTVCLDFDGVCNTYRGWKGENELFEPEAGLRLFLEILRDRGYKVVIHSTRRAEKIQAWLQYHDLQEFVHEVVNHKPPAIVYVDDRAVCFKGDFAAVLDEIENFRPYWEKKEP